GRDDGFDADQWMEPKEQRKVDDFIIFAMGAATQALQDAGWKPASYEDQIRYRRTYRNCRDCDCPERKRATPRLAFFHSRTPHQFGLRLRVHRAQTERSQSCRR